MMKLTDLGFTEYIIFETILSTYNPDGTADAAPMGVTMKDPKTISLNLYDTSQTSYNLKANKFAVINLTSNIEVFYKTTFKEANPNGSLPQEWFEKAEAVKAPFLRSAYANVAVSVVKMEQNGAEKTKFTCKVERIDASKIYPQVYCRAMSATLEAILHATRVMVFAKDEAKKEQVRELSALINNCNEVVNRVAPNSVYSAVMTDLMKRIEAKT